MTIATKIKGYVLLTMKFDREGSKWIGTCMELGTSTYTRTLKKTIEELDALVLEHLNVLEEIGERERFFQKWNIKFHKTEPAIKNVSVPVLDTDWQKDWQRFIREGLASHPRTTGPHYGPFYQPGIFPIRPDRIKQQADLVGV